MKEFTNKLDTVGRRKFMVDVAKTFFGVSVGGSAASLFANPIAQSPQVVHAPNFGKAKRVIYLYMSGGMTHLDTFDPKPKGGEEIMGSTKVISGKGDIQLGHYMSKLAAQSDQVSLVRSMTSTQGAHAQGKYFMRTGYSLRSSIVHPATGGWVSKLKKPDNKTMPDFVTVNCGNNHPGAGFFEPELDPLPVGNAAQGLKNSELKGVGEKAFDEQLDVRHKLDADFDRKFHAGYRNVRAYSEMYEQAVKLMRSEDLEAFDLSKENQAMHKLYGDSNFAKGCLLARRLVEKNVNFVEVELAGFDWHTDNFEEANTKLPQVDQAIAALIADLKQRGLLDTTLIAVATEFGRTPKINQNGGRDHFPKAFSCMLAGAGVKGGHVHGKTDEKGSKVVEGEVDASDFNATIGHLMGIEYNKTLYSPSKRPFKMSGKSGRVIKGVLG